MKLKPRICPKCGASRYRGGETQTEDPNSKITPIEVSDGSDDFHCTNCDSTFNREEYETCEECARNPKKAGFNRCKTCINGDYGAQAWRMMTNE